MRRFEKHLERALNVAAKLTTNGKIDERMKADISSFGTALLHNGLLPAVALFSDSSTDSGRRRVKLLNAVYFVLKPDEVVPSTGIPYNSTLLLIEALSLSGTQRGKLRTDIMDAVIAMKLAIRTFELEIISQD